MTNIDWVHVISVENRPAPQRPGLINFRRYLDGTRPIVARGIGLETRVDCIPRSTIVVPGRKLRCA